jgi:hypothetical protein
MLYRAHAVRPDPLHVSTLRRPSVSRSSLRARPKHCWEVARSDYPCMPVPWSYPLSVTLSATAQLQGREVVWQPFESLELPEPHHVSDVRANRCAPCGGSSLYVVYISKAQHACVSRVGTPVHALRACTTSPIAFLPPGGLLVAGHVTTPLGVMYVIGVGIEGSVGVPVRTGAAVVRMDAPRDSPRLLVAPKLIHLEGWNVGAGTAQSPGACLELQSNIASTPNSDVSLYWRSPAVSTPPALGFFPLSHRLNTWRAGLCSVASPQMRSSGAGCPMRHALALRGGGWEVTPEGTVWLWSVKTQVSCAAVVSPVSAILDTARSLSLMVMRTAQQRTRPHKERRPPRWQTRTAVHTQVVVHVSARI